MHDLVGKLLQAPWYKIWGLDREKTPSTTFTIGIDTADVVREKTKECAGQFNILKVKLGRDNDKEMIETIRSVTDLPIAVDANQGWKDKRHARHDSLAEGKGHCYGRAAYAQRAIGRYCMGDRAKSVTDICR